MKARNIRKGINHAGLPNREIFSSTIQLSITSHSASFCAKCFVFNSNNALLQADFESIFLKHLYRLENYAHIFVKLSFKMCSKNNRIVADVDKQKVKRERNNVGRRVNNKSKIAQGYF